MARTAPAGLLVWGMAVAAVMLPGTARAQTASEFSERAEAQSAYREWRRLSQSEVNCVDHTLRRQGTTLWDQIQRGVRPSSSSVAKLRNACQHETTADARPAKAQHASQSIATADTPAAAMAAAPTDQPAAAKATRNPDAVQKAADGQPQAEKAAVGEEALAQRAAANRAAIEKAVADKAAERAAAEKAEAERVAAEQAEMKRATAEKAAAERAAAEKATAAKGSADQAPVRMAQADANPAQNQPANAESQDDASQTSQDAALVGAAFGSWAAESRMSFIYGLISGPVLVLLGAIAVLLVQRRRRIAQVQPSGNADGEFDRLVAAVMAELDRRQPRTLPTLSPKASPPMSPRMPRETPLPLPARSMIGQPRSDEIPIC